MFRDDDDYFAPVDEENENIEKIRVKFAWQKVGCEI